MNKFIIGCYKGTLFLQILYNAEGRGNEILKYFHVHNLISDGGDPHPTVIPLTPIERTTLGGADDDVIRAGYRLTPEILNRISHAHSVGLAMKPSKDASIFMGFYDMNFADGAEKFAGLLNTCQATGTMPGYASPQSHAPVPPRYPLPQVAGHSLPPLYPSSEPPRSQAYADGRRDRQAWEDWYNGLPEGAYRQGASYWASVRSTKQAASGCTGSGYTGSAEQANWVNGCYAAKAKLDASDQRRAFNLDYKAGWNSP